MVINELFHLTLMTVAVFITPFLAKHYVPARQSGIDANKTASTHGRVVAVDLLRAVAIWAIVIIHVVLFYREVGGDLPLWFLDAFQTSMRFAVPVFFILSGLMLRPFAATRTSVIQFYKRRFLAVFVPYMVVHAVLAVIEQVTMTEFLYWLVSGSASPPMYFVVVLMQLYLLYPFIIQLATRRWFVYTTFAVAFAALVVPGMQTVFGIPLVLKFLFFFVWGIYMRAILFPHPNVGVVYYWLAIFILFWVLYAFYPASFYNVRPFYGLAVFMILFLVFHRRQFSEVISTVFARIGENSLWIFLTHFFVLQAIIPPLYANLAVHQSFVFATILIASLLASTVVAFVAKSLYKLPSRILKRRHS